MMFVNDQNNESVRHREGDCDVALVDGEAEVQDHGVDQLAMINTKPSASFSSSTTIHVSPGVIF